MNSFAAVVSVVVATCGAAAGEQGALAREAASVRRLEFLPLRFDAQPEVERPDEDRIVEEAIAEFKSSSSVAEPDGAAGGAERIPFGRCGAEYLTFGAGVAHNFSKDMDYNLHVTWSRFVADELEFAVEAGAWYFAQAGDDTVGLNGSLLFRWHFWHPEVPKTEPWDWTVYADLGIGLMGAFDNVPATGTGFAFTPRAGVGFTKQLDDAGTRLQVGLRWHHISNGRIEGDVRNPSRDSIMVYAGIMIPF